MGEFVQKHILLLTSALFVLAIVAAYGLWRPRPGNEMAGSNPPLANAKASNLTENPAGYLGPEKCAACHAERVNEFRESRHYLACVEASDATLPAAFLKGDAEFTPPGSPVTFRMVKNGDEFQQVAIRRTPAGTIESRAPVSLVYGFGAETDDVYFSWKNNQLSELPMSWLHPSQEWGTGGFDHQGGGDYSRPTNPRCLECHNTWLEHIPGTPNEYRRESLIAGVTCEVCHGPGKDHVGFHEQNPDHLTPMHILRPAELTRDRKMDLCANCHSNAMKHRGPAFSYRPGLPLADFYKTLTTRNPENDHVANQTSYLLESKCYQQSNDLTCITCHDPHAARGEASLRGVGVSACMNCHKHEDCGERGNLPDEVRDNCVGCHMPKRTKIQVNFDTKNESHYAPVPAWDHRIGIDRIARDEVMHAWHLTQPGETHTSESQRLAGTLARVHEDEGDKRMNDYRYLAAADSYRRSEAFHASDSVRSKRNSALAKVAEISSAFVRAEHERNNGRIDDAIATLEKLLVDQPDHAEAHGRLGTLYAMKERNTDALEQWGDVLKYDPDNAYGEGMIGWYWYLQDEPEKALAALTHADEIEPYSFRINFNLGLTLVKLGRNAEALTRFRTANRIEPQNADCRIMLNLGL